MFALMGGLVGGYWLAMRRERMATLKRRRASRTELDSLTREELYRRAQEQDLPGRSNMSKEELHDALAADAKSTGQEIADTLTGRKNP